MTKAEFIAEVERRNLPIKGWGICGLNSDNKGYIYNSEGYGNMETYISLENIEKYADISNVSFHDANGDSPHIYFN